MKQLQKWFDLIAGISSDEATRQARAREIFRASAIDFSTLQKPACWRRTQRVASR